MNSLRAVAVAWFGVSFFAAANANTLPVLPAQENNIVLCTGPGACATLADTTTGPLSYSNTITNGGAQITLAGSASSDLFTGDLHAFESYSIPPGTTTFDQANTAATLRDTVTISSAALDGTPGYFAPVFTITGTDTPSALGELFVAELDSAGNSPLAQDGQFFAGNAQVVLSPMAFHYGQPFYFASTLGAITFPSPSFLSGTSDYSQTAVFAGFDLFDGSNDPVSSAEFSSANGTSYFIAAPEPGSMWLIGLGLVAILAFRLSKRSPSAIGGNGR